jgi:Na+/H+ antiporter NhaD/arsenite permease-like protein
MNIIPLIVLALVFLIIIIRKIGKVNFKVWQIMSLGALAVLLTGSISFLDALKSIKLDVMLFLFGMFVVGQALEDSGYLSFVSYKLFRKAKSLDILLLLVIFGAGICSAILMNDTLAIVGTPIMLLLSRQHKVNPKLLILALAFSITIGSVMSPIGNPQNLLIATQMKNSFIQFFKYLIIPTVINLVVLFVLLKLFFREQFHNSRLKHEAEEIKNPELALIAKISVGIVLLLIIAKIILYFFAIDFNMVIIALAGAMPILIYRLFSSKFHIMRKLDWHTLLFFAAMFILMQSVWDTGFFQAVIENMKISITSTPIILGVSTVLSQFISNVPLVALYLPLLQHLGVSVAGLIALAVGSTIAGNMTILGAASNIIIFHKAERRENISITFWDFFKIGLPLTIINLLVYWAFIR